MHKNPLSKDELDGLRAHGLPVGSPSQLSDVFRQGMQFGASREVQRMTVNFGKIPAFPNPSLAVRTENLRPDETTRRVSYAWRKPAADGDYYSVIDLAEYRAGLADAVFSMQHLQKINSDLTEALKMARSEIWRLLDAKGVEPKAASTWPEIVLADAALKQVGVSP